MKTSVKLLFYLVGLLCFISCNKVSTPDTFNISEEIQITKLSKNSYIHTSYLDTESFGKVPCNGMIVIDNNEALVFDTPINDSVSATLINWIENNLKSEIKGVVATHFHDDCLGGLEEFHKRKIPSYARNETIRLAKTQNNNIPQKGFDTELNIKVGKKNVINMFHGEGHTSDNIISYFPNENILFGGCLIKSKGAKKGYLGDANTQEWSNTVSKIKETYPEVKIVIPGHGAYGGQELLEYTISLFQTTNKNERISN
nr:subclass B1 metallo-beta-lactamase [Aquimarina sediminis]